ncbi:hypothetical protein VT930_11955 [Mycobacterium sherrisii]|uniref:hypothetical protein n=1 Tax=Mycobacterium sherrisii TaxID=243061 RepID=UPI002DDD6F8A|nr:hypothetical protein [Mycobacterium sherrisii]MEC4763818.1 hypothetical protein [Mycobacterium sherrisii]
MRNTAGVTSIQKPRRMPPVLFVTAPTDQGAVIPMAATKRIRRGEDHHHAKLNENTVHEIRAAYAAGATQRDLAKQHGVSEIAILCVVHGRTWGHVPVAPEVQPALARRHELGRRGEANGTKLTNADVLAIRAKYAAGDTNHANLAREYSVSTPTISNIVRRKTWSHI